MKNMIVNTFTKMVEAGKTDKITVKALIKECHISRQTFYYHFQDLMDMLEWSIRQTSKQLVEESLKANNIRSALHIFISFVVDHFQQFEKLMNSERRFQMERIMIEVIENCLSELVRNLEQDCSFNYLDREVWIRYSTYGLVGVLLAYGGKESLDQDRLAFQLEQILYGKLALDKKRKQLKTSYQ